MHEKQNPRGRSKFLNSYFSLLSLLIFKLHIAFYISKTGLTMLNKHFMNRSLARYVLKKKKKIKLLFFNATTGNKKVTPAIDIAIFPEKT